MMDRSGGEVRASGARVEELLHGFDGPLPPGRARAQAEALVASVVQLYGEGLARVLEILEQNAGDRADEIVERLCCDELLSGLLAIHGLHPIATVDRAQAALAKVRPYIESHQGHVEITGFEGATVHVRMSGSCHGCPSSAATLKLAIEKAILEACPELEAVEAEGLETAATTLHVVSDWLDVGSLPSLAIGGHATLDVSGTPVLLVHTSGTFYAYRNRCPGCNGAFDDACIESATLICATCHAAFDVIHAGREAGGAHALEPFPLLVDHDRLQLSIPVGA